MVVHPERIDRAACFYRDLVNRGVGIDLQVGLSRFYFLGTNTSECRLLDPVDDLAVSAYIGIDQHTDHLDVLDVPFL